MKKKPLVPKPPPTVYAVFAGRRCGLTRSWTSCSQSVHRWSGNGYRGYPTVIEGAISWLGAVVHVGKYDRGLFPETYSILCYARDELNKKLQKGITLTFKGVGFERLKVYEPPVAPSWTSVKNPAPPVRPRPPLPRPLFVVPEVLRCGVNTMISGPMVDASRPVSLVAATSMATSNGRALTSPVARPATSATSSLIPPMSTLAQPTTVSVPPATPGATITSTPRCVFCLKSATSFPEKVELKLHSRMLRCVEGGCSALICEACEKPRGVCTCGETSVRAKAKLEPMCYFCSRLLSQCACCKRCGECDCSCGTKGEQYDTKKSEGLILDDALAPVSKVACPACGAVLEKSALHECVLCDRPRCLICLVRPESKRDFVCCHQCVAAELEKKRKRRESPAAAADSTRLKERRTISHRA